MIAITACAAALAAVTVGLLLRSEYEKKHFVTDQYEIESPKLPDGAAFRCVFLSDLHDNVYGTDNEPLVAAIRAFKPDAVLIGGDMMPREIWDRKTDDADEQGRKNSCTRLS